MKFKTTIYTSILTGVSLTMPAFSFSHGLQYTEVNRNAPNSFLFRVQTEGWETERPGLGGKGIYSYGSEMFREPKLFREPREQSSEGERGTRSYSDLLGPSFDMPDSVNGHSRGADRWWDRPSSADPMAEDLKRMDSGVSGPGSLGSYPGR